MAQSLGMSSALVEPEQIGGRLWWIPNILNLAGHSATGPSLARKMYAQIIGCGANVVHDRATRVEREHEYGLRVLLASGRTISAAHVVWAAGLQPFSIYDDAAHGSTGRIAPGVPEIQLAGPSMQRARRICEPVVIGGDRPLGTLIRQHPELAERVFVYVPPRDSYKLAEIATYVPPGRIRQFDRLDIAASDDRRFVLTAGSGNAEYRHDVSVVVTNLGSRPVLEPARDLITPSGSDYAQPSDARISLAGDVAHESHQRVAVALGDGARCALDHFYETTGAYQNPRLPPSHTAG